MANNSNQSNLNVGLNLNGNAVSSVDQLVKHMTALKQAAVDVGNAISAVDAKTEAMSAQTLKKLNQQMKLLTTSPQMLEQQYYQSINKTAQAGRLNSVINTTRHLHNPNTLNQMVDQYGSSTVKQAIETRLNAAQLKNDTKAIQRAQLEMATFKAEMAKYNVSLKGLQQIKAEQDALVSQMLSTPVGAAALRGGMQSKLGRNYTTAAQEKLIREYMANPNSLAPANASGLATAGPEVLKQQQQMNASKIQATQRLMGQSLLEGTQQSKAQYDLHVKTLAALEDEKTKLQAIGNLRRANLRTQDQELKTIRETTNTNKANEKLNSLLNGNLKTRTLSAEQITQLPQDNLLNREIAMKTRLKQANEAMRLSESLGNKKAQKESAQLAISYQKELDMISRRKKQFDQADKPNSMVSRFQDMSSGESSGALLGIQGILMRNYMLWGAFVGSIAGSYAFLRDFELALKQTQAISQATNTQVEQLRENILSVAENSRFTAIEITEAATALAQAGFSMSEIETTLESVTLLATATGSTLKETVDIATASLGAFQLSASNMPSIVNQITQAMNLSKLDIQKFQLAVQYAGNAASDAGLNFEELLASVSTVANAGVRSGSTLGTGFRQLLSDLIAPSTKFEKILTRLGLTTADVDVRTNGLVGTLKQLKEAGFTTADAYESFEVRSVAFYTALANNLDTYDDLLANLDNNTAAMDANEIQMNSLGAQTERMFNQFKAVAEVAGGPLRDALTVTFRLIGDLFVGIKEMTDNALARFIVQVVAGGVALGGTVVIMKGVVGTLAGLGGALKAVSLGMAATATTTVAAGTAFTVMGRTIALTNPVIFALSAALTAAILVASKFTKSNQDLKNSVEASQTAVNQLKDSAANLQTEIAETDKKIVSLESRFESLQEDPAAVALEFTNLKTKAAELGVSLGEDLVSSIESVRKGWEILRNELSKSLVIDLSQQIEEIDLLAQKMLSLKVAEASSKPDMFSEKGAREGGYGKVVDYNSLNYFSNTPLSVATDKNAAVRRNAQFASGNTYNTNLFKAISDANKAAGGKGRDIDIEALFKEIAGAPRQLSLMTPEEQEAAIPKMREQYLKANAVLNNAKKQFLYASRETKDVDQKKAAEEMVETISNFQSQIADRAGVVNSLYSNFNQRDSLTRQKAEEESMIDIRSKLISGNVSDLTAKSDFGNAYALGKQGKAKGKYNTRELAALMPDIKKLSKQYGVPEDIIIGHMITESGVNQGVTSEAGAMGLMQVMPNTAKDMGLDVSKVKNDKLYNLEAGVRYLAKMKKDTKGSWEDASRAYFMGAGGLNKYKTSNGKSYSKGFNQSTDYVKTVYANVLDFQKTRGGRYSILDTLDIPQNTVETMSQIDTLNSIIDGAKSMVASKGDYTTLSDEDKKTVDKWLADIRAAEKIISEKSASTNNIIQAAQARDKSERERAKGFERIDLQKLEDTVQTLELQIAEQEARTSKGEFTKASVEKINDLYAQLREAQQKQQTIESRIKVLDSASYDGTNLVVDQTFQQLADMQLDSAIKKSDAAIDKKRRESLEKGAKGFADRLKAQNDLFMTTFKNEISDIQNDYDNAMSILDFDRKQADRNFREFNGLTSMGRERALMDDPRYRDQYTETQRSKMDREIELLSNQATRAQTPFMEADRNLKQSNLVELEAKLSELRVARSELEANFKNEIEKSGLTEAQIKTLEADLKKELNKNAKEINKNNETLWKLQDDIANLDLEIKAARNNGLPEQMDMGSIFREKAAETYRLTQTSGAMDNNITTVLDGINGAFNNLINTAIDASDNVDDFFKILTGGAEGTREAFKAMGYSIVQTMAKIVQDTMVKKFMSMMMNWIFPEGGASVGGGGGGILGTIIGGIAGAFGQGVVSGAGTLWGSAASGGSAGLTGVIGAGGGVHYMSQGGRIVGSNKNVDDVPIMGADGEYMLPSSVTETVGLGFLERLRKDPNSVVNDKIKLNTEGKGKSQVPSFTNVYVVSPDKVPSSTSQSDIIVAVEDNISRNGSLKQLIKQVANG